MLPEIWDQRLSAPVIAAPMFMVSNPELVIACCRAGVIGTFPALNQRNNAGYVAWLDQIENALGPQDAPFGVNFSLRADDARLDADIAVTVARKVPVVLTSLGISAELVERVHAYGGLIFHDVVNMRHASKAIAAGVDGLILVCAGAGGHAGTLNPFAFVAEVRRQFAGIVILAGGINDGTQIAAARMMGADMVSMGTRFIATQESGAPDSYKQMILQSKATDIVYTSIMTGVPASFLQPSIMQWGLQQGGEGMVDSSTRTVQHQGRSGHVWRDIWSAGQGIGTIEDIPSAYDLCRRLAADHAKAIVSH